jgi:HEPN domain-containing protein
MKIQIIHVNPDRSKDWIKMARSSLGLAKCGKMNEDILFEDLCYQCEQTAEKALKAFLIFKKGFYLKTHKLHVLIKELENINCTIPKDIKNAAISFSPYARRSMFPFKFPFIISPSVSVSLTDHIEKTRYPGEYLPLDEQAYKHALDKAEIIVSWVEQQIR